MIEPSDLTRAMRPPARSALLTKGANEGDVDQAMEYADENMVLVDYWHTDTDVLVSSYEVVEHVGKADGSGPEE